ncbi:MAG: hypothetical protein ACMUHX_04540 [bacterium]
MLKRILEFTGISATTSQQRCPMDNDKSGDIWIYNLKNKTSLKLTNGIGYRFPVFLNGDKNIVAMQGDSIVQVPLSGGKTKRLYEDDRIIKIVGTDKKDQDKILLLFEDEEGALLPGILSIVTGKVTYLDYDNESKKDRNMINHVLEQERVYGDTRIYLKLESREGLGGVFEWTDVYIKRGDAEPYNISNGDGISCSQPSMSHDGQKVAFIKISDL